MRKSYIWKCGAVAMNFRSASWTTPKDVYKRQRMDGKSVLDYFGGRIAAEIRLPEAIDRKLLCPFQYFGVTDTADLKIGRAHV